MSESTPQAAPGTLELAGTWRALTSSLSEQVEDPSTGGDWRDVSLPAEGAELGIQASGGTLWLERELELGEGWQHRFAPTGLAILISESAFGQYRLLAADQPIASWAVSVPGLIKPSVRLFEVPPEAVDREGRLLLTLRWQRRGWASLQFPSWRATVGDGWLLGDLRRLEVDAELRSLRQLNSDLPLLILALLYAALGAYHLQLFRRDRRCKEYLWFGATAIIFACYTLLFTHWGVSLSVAHPVLRRLYLAIGSVLVASSIQFLWPLLGRPIVPWLRVYQRSLLVAAVIALVLPDMVWTPWLEALFRFWWIPFLPAATIVLARELKGGNAQAKTIALGCFVVFAAGASEVASQVFGYGGHFELTAYAFAVFVVSMAFSLSNRFSRVHDELDVLRWQLEDMVEDRAAELSTANQKLRSEISERELAQEAMRMLERAVEQSIDGIMVADLEENSLFVNEAWARLHGRETFEIFGRRLDLFHSAEQMEVLRSALDQVQEEGSWEGEIAHQGKDGSDFPTWTSVTLLRDPEAKPVGFVMVARDISERKKAVAEKQRIETRLQESEKLRSLADLAGGIAHDYNNLLTGVLGNSSLALQELPEDSSAGEKLAQIGNAAERAAELTAQLLAYSGAETLILKPVDLDQLVVDSRVELLRVAGIHADLAIELSGGLPTIEADADQVRQAVLNLIASASACVLADGGGTITLETGTLDADRAYLAAGYLEEQLPPGEYVYLRVSSTSRDERIDSDPERLFNPFAGSNPSAAGQGSVRSLGLATVLATVRVHQGTVRVANRAEGGSVFELLFPAAGERASAAPDVTRARDSWRGEGTVLVVDDEFIMREVSRSILEARGFEVLATGEGAEALDLYRQHGSSIRVVLLDRTMPTMSGEEVLERILDLDAEARVVLMSGYKSDETIRALTDQGKAEFLPKPFRPEELVEKVRSMIMPAR